MKRIAIVLGFLFVTLVAAHFLLDAWGAAVLQEESRIFEEALKDVRAAQAARRLPARPTGAARDEDGAARIAALAEATEQWPQVVTPGASVEARAFLSAATGARALPPETGAFLAAHEADLRALDEALACTRFDWRVDYEHGFEAKLPKLVGIRMLGLLLVLDGRRREEAGDPQGAARRYVDALRLGCALADATLLHAMLGVAVIKGAEDPLGMLLAGAGAGPLGAETAAAIAGLEPLLPSATGAIRTESLMLGHLAGPASKKSFREVLALGGTTPGPVEAIYTLGPGRALFAHGIRELRDIYGEAISAIDLSDAKAKGDAFARLEQRAARSWNPLVRISFFNVRSLAERIDDMRVRVAKLREQAAAAK